MTSKTTTYAFILGRERELCLAELKAVLARFGFCFSISSVTDNVARFNIDAEAESVGALINILGGTVKIFRIMTSSSVISTPRQGVEKSYKISPTPTESSGGRDDSKHNDFKFKIIEHICDNHKVGKLNYGISSYTKEFNQRSVNNLGLSIKKDLKKDYSLRFVEAREGSELSSIASLKNKLDKDGFEFGIFADNSVGVLIGLTNAEEWNERDYGKPAGDKRSGMLPPKLARAMINLALGQTLQNRHSRISFCHSREGGNPVGSNTAEFSGSPIESGMTDKGKVLVVDPFCGSGNIILEAIMLGLDVFGSDVSEKAVNDSKKNVEWLKSVNSASHFVIPAKAGIQNLDPRVSLDKTRDKKSEDDSVKIIQADAAGIEIVKLLNCYIALDKNSNTAIQQYDNIVLVTEPYLGEPKKFNPTYNSTVGEYMKIKELYLGFLNNFAAHYPLPTTHYPLVICLVFPLVETVEGKRFSLYQASVDEIKKIGYTELTKPLLYGRDYQVVKREIVLLGI